MAETAATQKRSKRSRHDDPKMIGCWRLGRTIGKGSSGRVKIARHTRTGEYAAVKIVSKQALVNSRMSMTGISEQADKILLSIEREIVIMKLIDHPNILSLYDVWETSNELYLILEYVPNGELFDHLIARGRLPIEEALQYFQQIISAVDYCHRFNIAHRDLKPENLLLDKNNNIKVADFGMAAWEGGTGMLETSCGSPHYASPEVVAGKAYKGNMSDIWSCGVILYALLVGRLPFDDENIRHLLDKVKKAKYVMPDDIPLGAQDLLARMLEKDVNKRITMKQILLHPWFTCRPPKLDCGPTIPPPNLDVVHQPVKQASEVDTDILANLRTLWHGAPEKDILEALLNEKSNWEKTVYHLLLQYRTRRLEDYNGEEEQNPSASKVTPEPVPTAAPEQPPTVSSSSPPQSPLPLPETPTEPLISSNIWSNTQATLKPVDKTPTVPLRLPQPAGPRPPPIKIIDYPITHSLEPSPVKLVSPGGKPPLVTRPLVPDSPQLPPISQSALGEDSILQFISQVAHHVGSTPPRQLSLVPTKGTMSKKDEQAKSPGEDEDDGRFADAEEDHTGSEESSLRSSVMTALTSGSRSGPSSPGMPGTPGASSIPEYGLGISAQHQRMTPHIPILPLYSRPGGSKGFPHPGESTQGVFSTKKEIDTPILMLPPPVYNKPTSHSMSRGGLGADKENANHPTSTRNRPRSDTVKAPSVTVTNTKMARRRTIGDRHVQIVLPGEDLQMRSKQSQSTVGESSDTSSSSAEKPTWFANLFKFKPATFNLLSAYDASVTRDECKRLLLGLGVAITVENTGHLGCRFNGVSDPSGVMEEVKPVRFRIEIRGVIQSHSLAGFKTSVLIIQDKGALSSFKLLYNRLRREWDLDAPMPILKTPKTPRTPGSVLVGPTSLQNRVYAT